MKAILVLMSFFLLNSFSFGMGTFDVQKYINQCGGKIYPSCDSKDLNQLTIYKEAEAQAIKENKKILLIMGADWCPPCNTLNDTLKSNPDFIAELEQQFLVVELSGDSRKTKSSKDLSDYLGVYIRGYPTVFKIEPENKKSSMVFLQSYEELEKIKESILEVKVATDLIDEVKKMTHLDKIPMEFFDVPVDLNENYGQYPYFKSDKGWFSDSETEADKYLNAGIARINLFNWLDAARCFKQALKIEENNVLAKAFLAYSYSKVSRGQEAAKLANVVIGSIDMTLVKDKKTKAWVNFLKSFVFSEVGKLIDDPFTESYDKTFAKLREVAGPKDTEVLSLGAFIISHQEAFVMYNSVLRVQPNHAGALHYLVHYYENSKAYSFAEEVGLKLVEMAPDSAHAQHMLGHIAPRLEKWDLAEKQFLRASELHAEWSKKYNVSVFYDWHYSHNLDLLGSTYVGLNQLDRAMDLFAESCKDDFRGCLAALNLGAYLGTTKGFGALTRAYPGYDILNNEYYKGVFRFYMIETELEKVIDPLEKTLLLSELTRIESKALDNIHGLLKYIAESYLTGRPLDIKISNHISLYAKDRLGCASFDGWGKGMLDLMRVIKFSKLLGYDQIEKDVNQILESGLGIEFNYTP